MNTSIGTELNTSSNTSLKLRSWEYSQTNQYMEISFDVHNSEDSQSIMFTPVAHTNVDKRKDMNVSTALNKDNTLVVQIKDVPSKWEVISLRIQDNTDDNSGKDMSMTGANFYCDIRQVMLNELLKPKAELDYQVESVQNQIADVKAQITDLQKEIEKEKTDIEQLNFDIVSLKENQKYQTKDEIAKSNAVINSKTSEINNHKNSILNYQEQIKDYNIKLQKLSLKLTDTKAGKTSASSLASSAASPSHASSSSQSVTVD